MATDKEKHTSESDTKIKNEEKRGTEKDNPVQNLEEDFAKDVMVF